MKKLLRVGLNLLIIAMALVLIPSKTIEQSNSIERQILKIGEKESEESTEEQARFSEERYLYEFHMQVDPLTGQIPKAAKDLEFRKAKEARLKNNNNSRVAQTSFISRGPSNLGGRTRTIVFDISDTNGNTILAGGVTGGVFRTTDGGTSWTKVSPYNEIHNVTTIVQDPRSGQENVWYYGTGEYYGSGSLSGSRLYGQGIWTSTNNGVTWAQMPTTASNQTSWDSDFDYINKLAVHPVTGDLYAAVPGKLLRFDGTWHEEIADTNINSGKATDVVITTGGRVYAGFSGTNNANREGVWTSIDGVGGWTRINEGVFTPTGRVVLALAPSNQDYLYILYDNGNTGDCALGTQEADLWLWNQGSTSFADYSSTLPLEPCDNPDPPEISSDPDNNPFSVQDGYDLVISVKPDNPNFVVIGGTNAYEKTDISLPGTFARIGGYNDNTSYALYDTVDGDTHHPDIHALVFNPFSPNVMFSGTDGGVHKTTNITALPINWTNLNNNYQTYQYYHVAIDPVDGSDFVLGGAQDNGTSAGGMDIGAPNKTVQYQLASGDGVAVAISSDNSCFPFFLGYQNGTIYRYCNTYEEITPEMGLDMPYDSQFVTYYYLDQDNNNALYYAAKNTLLRTKNATTVSSSTWEDLGDTSTFGHTDNFQRFSTSWGTYNPASSYLLMGGDKGHIYRLDDPQNVADLSSAINITPPGASVATGSNYSIVTGLAIHPTNNNIILATYSNYNTNSIFLSTNKGATWTLVERNLDAHSIRSAAIVENSGETSYFVGTARGLYSSTDPTSTNWVIEAPNEIGYAVVSDLKYRPSDHKLLIGTHGNGMYQATIDTALGIDDYNNISNLIKLYPNPVQDELNIKLPISNGERISYTISSLSGQTVSKGILINETIDVSQMTSGMYILQLKTGDGRKGAKSFIKR